MRKFTSAIVALIAVIAVAMSTLTTAFAVDLSKDGEYTVNVYLVQKEKDEKTPASKGILEQAKIEVKNGKATMIIDSQPVKVTGITATLQSMTVFPGTEEVDGKEAKVVSRDSKGDPNKFSFELPHTKNFIDIRVYTGLAFPKSIGSRLKVDWSSLKYVGGTQTTKVPAKTTTKAVTNVVDTTTEANGSNKPNETTTLVETTTVAETTTVVATEAGDTADESVDGTNDGAENEDVLATGEETSPKEDSKSILTFVIPAVAAVAVIAVIVVIIVKKKKN